MLKELGWLSVKHHIVYHSIMLMWKVRTKKFPERLVFWLERKTGRKVRIETTERCWTRKTGLIYKKLTRGNMEGESISKFKTYAQNLTQINVMAF